MPGLPVRLLAPLCTLALLAAGCGAGVEDDPAEDYGPLEAFIMGTGPVGGTYYPLGGAMAQMWNEEVGEPSVTTLATGGSAENLRMLADGEANLAMAVNGTAAAAAAGEDEFEGEPVELALLGNLYPEVVQIAAAPGSGIATLDDLAGRRVAVGPPGSATQATAEAVLEAAGVVPGETVEDDFGTAALALTSGEVDAAIGVLAVPDVALGEAAASSGLTMVPVPDDVRARLIADDPTLAEAVIPAGAYDGVDGPTATVRSWAALYAPAELDEDQVYALVKALYEHTGDIENAAAASITATTATEGSAGVGLHPGAERYFAEHGG
ncbi:TAXI family TRAP transporter solute-binding subunit [Glycomyces tenuis]|uniref:TAXI family TRAP transporter solute-binding subunit n=1 Tax=Glycomyces tenuis TaxID=58116 RepID=UPI0003FA2C40|nr:TAXI family TRAP transporter solute-binding subunit [Glycomyces tenuis]